MTTFERVREIIIETTGIDDGSVKMESSLKDDLGMDSLDSVELLMKMEDQFGIKIPDETAEKVETVSQLANAIDNILSGC